MPVVPSFSSLRVERNDFAIRQAIHVSMDNGISQLKFPSLRALFILVQGSLFLMRRSQKNGGSINTWSAVWTAPGMRSAISTGQLWLWTVVLACQPSKRDAKFVLVFVWSASLRNSSELFVRASTNYKGNNKFFIEFFFMNFWSPPSWTHPTNANNWPEKIKA